MDAFLSTADGTSNRRYLRLCNNTTFLEAEIRLSAGHHGTYDHVINKLDL
jgi:hypothetical protein